MGACTPVPMSGSCSSVGKAKCFLSAGAASRAKKVVSMVLKTGVKSFKKEAFRNMLPDLESIVFKFVCPTSACPEGSCDTEDERCLKLSDDTDSVRASVLEGGDEEGSVVTFEVEGSDKGLVDAFNAKQLPGVVAMNEEWQQGDEVASATTNNGSEEGSESEEKKDNGFILPVIIGLVSAVVGCMLIAGVIIYKRSKSEEEFYYTGEQGIDMSHLAASSPASALPPPVNEVPDYKSSNFVSELRI